jgi:high-affinity iron transporter
VWLGVGGATGLCAAIAVGLQIVDSNLPQREQEGLETVVAVVAVAMVTSMIVWTARHARSLRSDLEASAGAAIANGSVLALVFMAFLAVLREGLETAVFLLSAFQASTDRAASGIGAVLGIALAVAIGFGVYRGGVRINLSRFFAATGLVLVLVAAGLVAFALHTAHEAGWLNAGQRQLVDLSWLIKPGTVRSAVLTGMLGVQPKPTLIEGVGWLLYFVPVTLFVVRSSRRKPAPGAARPVVAA